jgi:glycosyltransferase involved in cell wall biosynthesis
MRVTHIITRLVIGGAQENTVATVLGLRQKPDVYVRLISGPTIGSEGSMESSFATCPDTLSIVPDLVRPVHPWKDVRAWIRLTNSLRREPPDIVHTHSGKAGILGRLAAKRAGVPIIIHHIHGPSFGPFQGPVANAVFLAAEKIAVRTTTHFLCSANAMTRRYLAAGIGRPEMYTRILSGFRIEPFVEARNDLNVRARLGLPEDAFVIGKIGRLAQLKGHEDLFKAFAVLLPQEPRSRLLLIGDGALRAKLEALTAQLGLRDKVIFAGLVAPAEVPRFIGIMDCLAHLSQREALSRALPQALAAGKPVIAYDFDGADEICLEGETGFLVRTGDVSTVAHHLLSLSRDAELRARLGQRGQQLVKEQFRVENMIEQIYQLYRQLLATHTDALK